MKPIEFDTIGEARNMIAQLELQSKEPITKILMKKEMFDKYVYEMMPKTAKEAYITGNYKGKLKLLGIEIEVL